MLALLGMVSIASAQSVVTRGTFGFQQVDIPPAGGVNLGGFNFSSSDPIYLEDAFGTDQLTLTNPAPYDAALMSTKNGFELGGPGLFYLITPPGDVPEGWNGLSVKTIICSAPVKSNTTLYAKFTLRTDLIWDTGLTPSPMDYNEGTVSSTYDPLGQEVAGQWQAIPEPTVAALVGLFGGSMLIGRRLFAKEA